MSPKEKGNDWVQVAEFPQTWQADLLVGRLRESGIEAEMLDQTFHQELLPNVRAFAVVRVFVPVVQEEQAKDVISKGFELPEDVDFASDEDPKQ
jgi:hypothetical protein